jgi:tetratricopeptide (TPR) repeat protein
MNRRERRAAPKKAKVSLDSGRAGTAAGLCEAGIRHLRAEKYLDAQLCCQQALAADSGHADSLHLMGLLSIHAAQFDLAVEWFARAIRQDVKPQYLLSLGTTLQSLGRLEEALKAFDKALQLRPDAAELWKLRGNVLANLERQDQALESFQHALKRNPRDWDAANKAGRLLHQLERFEEALACFNLCDELQPNNFQTLHCRALALHKLKRPKEALDDNPTSARTGSGERRHLQQYRQCAAFARPERRSFILVRQESGT